MNPRPKLQDPTLDVCILMSASGRGNPPCHPVECRRVMDQVRDQEDWTLALDEKGRIEYQYRKMLKEGTFGHHWLRELFARGKVTRVRQVHLNRGVVTALKEAHFDSGAKEDTKYVETAAATSCKILVSHDYQDYSQRVCKILRKRLGVLVHDAPACLSWAEGLAKQRGTA